MVNRSTLVTLSGTQRLLLKIRRCEAEGALALPQHEFGLDVMALLGALRHRDHRLVPEIHAILRDRGVPIAEHRVINLLDRYDEVVSTWLNERSLYPSLNNRTMIPNRLIDDD